MFSYFSIFYIMFSLVMSYQVLCFDERSCEFNEQLRIVFTNSSTMLNKSLSEGRYSNTQKFCIYSSTSPNEAKEIIRCIYRHSTSLGSSLKGIEVLWRSSDRSIDKAILPLLRELITPENGFTALQEPWWEKSYGEQFIDWTHRIFSFPFNSSGDGRSRHIKVH